MWERAAWYWVRNYNEVKGELERFTKPREDMPRSDADLFAWSVTQCGVYSSKRASRWSHVTRQYGLGSTSAQVLCRRFGLDPDELVGGCDECKESQTRICSCNAEDYGLCP